MPRLSLDASRKDIVPVPDRLEEPVPVPPSGRASASLRLYAVAKGTFTAGFGAAALWWVPDRCHWVGWVCFVLFGSVGCAMAFLGLQGRAADLSEGTVQDLADGCAGELMATVCFAVLAGLLMLCGLR